MNKVSDFLLKVDGDSAIYSIGEIIPFQELCDVWPIQGGVETLLVASFS